MSHRADRADPRCYHWRGTTPTGAHRRQRGGANDSFGPFISGVIDPLQGGSLARRDRPNAMLPEVVPSSGPVDRDHSYQVARQRPATGIRIHAAERPINHERLTWHASTSTTIPDVAYGNHMIHCCESEHSQRCCNHSRFRAVTPAPDAIRSTEGSAERERSKCRPSHHCATRSQLPPPALPRGE
jgi:hypothetical protein